jgi:hypothetical protein
MEKTILGLLLVGLATSSAFCRDNDIKKPVLQLTEYDHSCLQELYRYYSKGSLFQEIQEIDEVFFDDYLDSLSKHIEILEQEIAENKSWVERSDVKAFFAELQSYTELRLYFLMYAGVFGFLGGLLMSPVYKEYQQIKLDKFKNVNIPNYMIKMLSFIKFTRAEKRYLDQREVNNINYSSSRRLNRKPYTKREEEKIKYLGRKLAPLQVIWRMCGDSVMPACVLALAGGILYCITPSTKNGMMMSLSACLERDQHILELLNNEKKARLEGSI